MDFKQPNILLIQSDQLAASFLGCYGNSLSDTPHISRLAEQGHVFESAYCNFPLCAPSRFSMLTGQLASIIGAYDNGAEFLSSIPTVAHYLKSLGYQTCLSGKMHFVGADQLHGFEQRLTTDIYPADFGWTGDWTEVRQRHSNDQRSFSRAGVCLRNPQMAYDDEVTFRTVQKIQELALGQDPRPFFLTASFTHPHDPYQCSPDYWQRYRHDDIDMPAVTGADPLTHDPYSMRLRQQYGLDRTLPDDDAVRNARHAYYGSISYLDDQIGHIMRAVESVGLNDNLVVAFTSDHGDMMGERGLWYKKSFFEQSVRVPLIISAPQYDAGRSTQPVSLVDLMPTLLELATCDNQSALVESISGKSLCPLMAGNSPAPDPVVYGEILAEGAMSPIVMVIKGGFKYIHSGIDPEQLFDLHNDPYELINLAQDSSNQDVRQTLRDHVSEKWDIGALTEQVQLSQSRRLFLAGLTEGGSDWDFVTGDILGEQCLRPRTSYNEWAYNNVLEAMPDIMEDRQD